MAITGVEMVASKNLVVVNMKTPLDEAQEIMKEKRLRHLPVIDGIGEIRGLLSERDMINIERLQDWTADIFMTTPVEYIESQTPLRRVVLKMLEKKISCLLVVDDENRAIGIVTTDDLLWHLAHLLKDEKEGSSSLLNILNMRTVGDITNELNLIGI